jgi:hypothetical protein
MVRIREAPGPIDFLGCKAPETGAKDGTMTEKKSTTATSGPEGWTDEERAAMKEHAAELRRAGGKGAAKVAEEAQACLDKIAEMPPADRVIAERVHAIVTTAAPRLAVKTW